jgi:branched-chain amino acid aminotransferase
LLDWGILRSDATFDVLKVTEGRFFRPEDHLSRLRRGCELLGMQIREPWSEIASILAECVERAELATCVAYAIVTRGVPPLGMLRDPRLARNRLYAMAVPPPWIADPGDHKAALSAAIGLKRRIPPESVDPTIKNFHWQDMVQSIRSAFAEGADTAIMLDRDGNVTEGPGFNIFMVKDGRVLTPAKGVLEGITRKSALEIADELGVPTEETTVSVEMLRGADEVFGTSTAGGIIPFGHIDGRRIGEGGAGPITIRIRASLADWYVSPEHTVAVAEARAGRAVIA